MTIPTLLPPSTPPLARKHLPLPPLTPSAFAPFGTAISPPFPPTLTTPPKSPAEIPPPLHPQHQPQAVLANQNSALKASPISQFINNYALSSSKRVGKPQMSMFSCFPRNLSGIGVGSSSSGMVFSVEILERHPFTTQTFCPLGLAGGGSSTVFLVIVAPSLPDSRKASLPDGTSKTIINPPDLSRLRAFIARGDQAVTYGPGTWHAPMVVLGQKRVDFLVSQYVNGVPEDDCQEVLLGENNVDVNVGAVLRGVEKEGKAKL